MTVSIIRISDEPIPTWNDDLELPRGEIGEIVVQGPVVTRAYYNRPESTALAKIADPAGGFWHRMGDVGYLDEQGRLWFCGRKSQRVVTPRRDAVHHSLRRGVQRPSRGLRTALVGVDARRRHRAGAVRRARTRNARRWLMSSCGANCCDLGASASAHAGDPDDPVSSGFPVDIRHNAKIFREKLAVWAGESNWHEGPGHRRRRLPRRRHRPPARRTRRPRAQPVAPTLSRAGRARRRADPRRPRRSATPSTAAAAGCDIVFHVAAKAGIWGRYGDYLPANVVGTENVLAACRRHGIRRLVYTSSPSVVFDGRDMEGVDESRALSHALRGPLSADQGHGRALVLAANGPSWRRWRCGRT